VYRLLATINPGTNRLAGPYTNWAKAAAHCSGYDDELILRTVESAMQKVQLGEAVYERDSVLFDEPLINHQILSCLLLAALESDGHLSVLDFGGSLGSTFYQIKDMLFGIKTLSWNIVEQKSFVELGKKKFATESLHFYDSIGECCEHTQPNVVILSSVLQYLESPYDIIEEILDRDITFLIFDRTPFSLSGRENVVVQHVSPRIHSASYPAWIFDYDKMLDFITSKYAALSTYDCDEDVIGIGKTATNYRGGIFRRPEASGV